ncbi:MAG: 2-amino-4-hydroxy-6-hydroxymethyldihydropteridine diphosphokinase [Candidatus Marinimicrobia bacterium]|nr:2-amino-4-hydroxy-6-hydroxymethyldihydropteridine diphosphokinase [Candidatus Neomarinimicrobiota bacterium]MCF7839541.1 2-amino-4-hydroxy-6-hydroxymethyldihydropteridine diphosphokinase [Candidatus Neomarinimicrobiota bacterium]MCF7901914.1 2-amino-4-hydroxy-6-hydroxymethyldihydropteridine diphosphokinase [Candidatus Neomarinimicrobiota bacterium]
MSQVVVSLGSNMSRPLNQLEIALERLRKNFTHVQCSSYYLTDPVGGPVQPDYVNACAIFETSLQPDQVLKKLQIMEEAGGRTRNGERNQPRTLDIDIILYDDLVLDEAEFILPHPRFRERRFVLVPLAELAPHLIDPVSGKTIVDLLKQCPDVHGVEQLDTEISA